MKTLWAKELSLIGSLHVPHTLELYLTFSSYLINICRIINKYFACGFWAEKAFPFSFHPCDIQNFQSPRTPCWNIFFLWSTLMPFWISFSLISLIPTRTATLKCISLHKDQPRRAVDSFYKIGQYVQSSCLPTKGTKFILSPLIITLGLSQIPVLYLQRDITLLCITLSQIPTV